MKDGLFEVGDIVKGLERNGYHITNQRMKKGEVVAVRGKVMLVKVLEHAEQTERNKEHYVDNNTDKFKLLNELQGDFWEDLEVL